ncbi:MAG: hypothetical protein QNK51_00390 [Chitinophagales bacterium]|tara:strand:- start:689 stop:916 length:228 start_codon:yes stop_codon:yes gene_type:complete
MIKKVRFNMDLRDIVDKSRKSKSGNIINYMEPYNDERLSELVDELISSHIKDFISNYIKKELKYSSLDFEGNLIM